MVDGDPAAGGGLGDGAWRIGPGGVADLVRLIPSSATHGFRDWVESGHDALERGYGADTDGWTYRTTSTGTQVAGLFLPGSGVLEGFELLSRAGRTASAGRALLRTAPSAKVLAASVTDALRTAADERRTAAFWRSAQAIAQDGGRAVLYSGPGDGRALAEAAGDAIRMVATTGKTTAANIRAAIQLGKDGVTELDPEALARGRAMLGGATPRNQGWAGQTMPMPPQLAEAYPLGVRFTPEGFPDFSPYALHHVHISPLGPTRGADFTRANRAAGLASTPPGFTWHHVEDGSMQLVPKELHAYVKHSGGVAAGKARGIYR